MQEERGRERNRAHIEVCIPPPPLTDARAKKDLSIAMDDAKLLCITWVLCVHFNGYNKLKYASERARAHVQDGWKCFFYLDVCSLLSLLESFFPYFLFLSRKVKKNIINT